MDKETNQIYVNLLQIFATQGRLNKDHYAKLSANPEAIDWLIRKYPERICNDEIACNPSPHAIEYIIKHIANINPAYLATNTNPYAMDILTNYFHDQLFRKNGERRTYDNLCWHMMESNPAASQLLIDYPPNIFCWYNVCKNTSPAIIEMFETEWKEHIDWTSLSRNPSAINIIEKQLKDDNSTHSVSVIWNELLKNPAAVHLFKTNNLSNIVWESVAANVSKEAIELLETYVAPENMDWFELSANPAAISLLMKHPNRIVWSQLSQNPAAIHLLKERPEKINIDAFVVAYYRPCHQYYLESLENGMDYLLK